MELVLDEATRYSYLGGGGGLERERAASSLGGENLQKGKSVGPALSARLLLFYAKL